MTQTDFGILYWIQENLRCGFLDGLSCGLSLAFEGGLACAVLAVAFLFFKKTRATGIMITVALLLVLFIGELGIKNIVCRVRPCNIDQSIILAIDRPVAYSFPSGHTSVVFATATVLTDFNKHIGRPVYVLAVIVGLSRMYLFVHYPTDVLCGAVFGTICGAIAIIVFKRTGIYYKLGYIGRDRNRS